MVEVERDYWLCMHGSHTWGMKSAPPSRRDRLRQILADLRMPVLSKRSMPSSRRRWWHPHLIKHTGGPNVFQMGQL